MPDAQMPPAEGANADPIPPAVPVAPPTQAGALAVGAGPPAWPKVIGVISIVLGAGGVLLWIWSLVAMLMVDTFVKVALQFGADPQAPPEMWTGGYYGKLVCLYVVLLLLAGLLLAAGIGLVRSRPWGAKLSVWWAWGKLAASVAFVVASYQMQQTQMELMTRDPSFPGGGPGGGLMSVFVLLSMLASLIWFAAFPVFVLVWFARSRIKEQVANWN